MAQLVERMAVNHKVRGSNPRGGDDSVDFRNFCNQDLLDGYCQIILI